MNEWAKTYTPRGLTIIAIHGPDYKGQLAVPKAIAELGITYPVADDQDKQTWKAYGIGGRPSFALIGGDGTLLHRQIGRVTTEQTKQRIEAALTQPRG